MPMATCHRCSPLAAGAQVDEAGLGISAEGQGVLADAQSLEEEIQCCVHVGLISAHPDEDVGARVAVQPAEGKVDLPDCGTSRRPPCPGLPSLSRCPAASGLLAHPGKEKGPRPGGSGSPRTPLWKPGVQGCTSRPDTPARAPQSGSGPGTSRKTLTPSGKPDRRLCVCHLPRSRCCGPVQIAQLWAPSQEDVKS